MKSIMSEKEIMTKDKLKMLESEKFKLFVWVSNNQPAMLIRKYNGNVHRLEDWSSIIADEGGDLYWLCFDGKIFYTMKDVKDKDKEEYLEEMFKGYVDIILYRYEIETGLKLRDKTKYNDGELSYKFFGPYPAGKLISEMRGCSIPLTKQQYIIFKRQYKTTTINNFL